MTNVEQKTIEIRTVRNKNTGLLVAFSDQLRGLFVPGRSESDLAEHIPNAVREILEAQGYKVLSIDIEQEQYTTGFNTCLQKRDLI